MCWHACRRSRPAGTRRCCRTGGHRPNDFCPLGRGVMPGRLRTGSLDTRSMRVWRRGTAWWKSHRHRRCRSTFGACGVSGVVCTTGSRLYPPSSNRACAASHRKHEGRCVSTVPAHLPSPRQRPFAPLVENLVLSCTTRGSEWLRKLCQLAVNFLRRPHQFMDCLDPVRNPESSGTRFRR